MKWNESKATKAHMGGRITTYNGELLAIGAYNHPEHDSSIEGFDGEEWSEHEMTLINEMHYLEFFSTMSFDTSLLIFGKTKRFFIRTCSPQWNF